MAVRNKLLFLITALALGVGALVFVISDPGSTSRAEMSGPELDVPVARLVDVERPTDLRPVAEIERTGEASRFTTVLWPLRVELDLLAAAHLPTASDIVPVGSGASASLSGRISGREDEPVRAELRFVAGANSGRRLLTDADGKFGASDLYPGLSVIELDGTGVRARREIRLRRGQETLLNIPFGRPGTAFGQVFDHAGEPLPGATVIFDGTQAITDSEGGFYIASVSGGEVMVEVDAPGHARYQELVRVASGRVNPKERLTFRLEREASLKVAVRGTAGEGPVTLYLLPAMQRFRPLRPNEAHRNARYPYHQRNPIEVVPGRPVTIDGLPPESVKVFAFRTGAESSYQLARLRAGEQASLQIEMKPATTLRGTVTLGGEPVVGAEVRLEAPDRVRATLGFFREPGHFLETAVLPSLPPALQETLSDPKGRFSFTAWEDFAPARFLAARGPDGRSWAGRFVRRGENDVELRLESADFGDGELSLDFPGRFQGLPVELVMNGSPVDLQVLAEGEPLVLSNLLSGEWKLVASWHGQPVLTEPSLMVGRDTEFSIELPTEAIEGQDEEAWARAGREFPSE